MEADVNGELVLVGANSDSVLYAIDPGVSGGAVRKRAGREA